VLNNNDEKGKRPSPRVKEAKQGSEQGGHSSQEGKPVAMGYSYTRQQFTLSLLLVIKFSKEDH